MKKENQFYNYIKNTLKDQYFVKIEHSLSVGIPDLLTIIDGLIAFIELKQTNTIKLENLGLNKFQIAWHIKHNKHNGNAFILVLEDKQSTLKLFRIGGRGVFSHIFTAKKSASGLKKIMDKIKTYKKTYKNL